MINIDDRRLQGTAIFLTVLTLKPTGIRTEMFNLFLRQVWTLTVKNLLITFVRPSATTTLRALVLPVVFIAVMYVEEYFSP